MDERFPATPMPFGFLLRRHRLEAELTQEALAERARVSARVVSDLERGVTRSPRAHTVWQLADALQLSPPERREFVAAAREGNGTHGDVDQMPIEVEEAHLDQPLPVGGFLGAIPSGPLIA